MNYEDMFFLFGFEFRTFIVWYIKSKINDIYLTQALSDHMGIINFIGRLGFCISLCPLHPAQHVTLFMQIRF